MASDIPPEMKEKFESLKMAIRAILVSANDYLTLNRLDRDYFDLHGKYIPYCEFGFPSLSHLLDAMPDVVGFETSKDGVLLFAKSSDKTHRMECLIARQRKSLGGVGHFGGIVPGIPREETPGTRERQAMITNRLLHLASTQPPNYIKSTDLIRLYELRYCEDSIVHKEFNCAPQTLFSARLSNYFQVRDVGRCLWIRLKDEERAKILAEAASAPKFPEGKNMWEKSEQQAAMKVVLKESNNSQTSVSEQDRRRTDSHGASSSIAVTDVMNSPNKIQLASGIDTSGAMAECGKSSAISPCSTEDENLLALAASKLDELIVSVKPKGIDDTTVNLEDTAPFALERPLMEDASEFSQSKGNQKWLRKTTSLSSLAATDKEWPHFRNRLISQNQTAVTTSADTASSSIQNLSETSMVNIPGFSDRLRQVLSFYPGGLALQNFELAYCAVIGDWLFHDVSNESKRTLMSLLQMCPAICQLVEENGTVMVKPSGRDETANMGKSRLKKSMSASNTKLRQVCLLDPKEHGCAVEQLKVECRQVLHACPNGVSYMGFSQAYKEIIGKRLDLASCGYLSLMELVDAMADLVLVEQTRDGVVLRERLVEVPREHTKSVLVQNDAPMEDTGVNDEHGTSDELLINSVWTILVHQDTKSLTLDEIPAVYQAFTGHALPKNIDEFLLIVIHNRDRFSFIEENDTLRIGAKLSWYFSQ